MKENRGRLGLRVNLEKTEVLCVGQQKNIRYKSGREDTDTAREWCISGWSGMQGRHTGTDSRWRIQTGANVGKKLGRVMEDRHISRNLNGKSIRSCLAPINLYGLETKAATEKLQLCCENNLVRVITGVKRYVFTVLGTVQSAPRFTPWQTCSFQCRFDFSGKRSVTLLLLREDYSFKHPPLSVARYSSIQLSELWQRGMDEIAKVSKRQQEDSNPG